MNKLSKFFVFTIIICQSLNADFINKVYMQNNISELFECGFEPLDNSSYTLSKTRIFFAIENTKILNTKDCHKKKKQILKLIKEDALSEKKVIGYQFANGKYNFNDSTSRNLQDSNYFIRYSNSTNSLEYSIEITNLDNKQVFDNSFVRLYKGNKILSAGKISQWWGPSEENSLILSNQARPFPIISFENNIPTKMRYFDFLGPVSYKIFLGKLERKREIPNAAILGMRIELNPNKRLNIGLSRTAQFGGDGRSVKLTTIKDIILGKDNQGKESPGNQLGALDIKYSFKGNEIYGQIVGEDEAGYLPSRTFYYLGFSKYLNDDYDKKISIETVETENKIPNYTYNHNFYRDGYRYLGLPIGASIDADSELNLISFRDVVKKNLFIKLRYFKGKINKNNSEFNYISNSSQKLEGVSFDFQNNFNDKILITTRLNLFDGFIDSDSSLFIKLEYKF